MSNTFENAITVTSTGVSITTSGVSASATIPFDMGNAVPKYIRVAATAAAYVRIGNGTPTAVTTDLLVQPGDAVILAVCGLKSISAIQVTAAGVVQVSPVENA
jgi:voltage-gated potassium channel Kch